MRGVCAVSFSGVTVARSWQVLAVLAVAVALCGGCTDSGSGDTQSATVGSGPSLPGTGGLVTGIDTTGAQSLDAGGADSIGGTADTSAGFDGAARGGADGTNTDGSLAQGDAVAQTDAGEPQDTAAAGTDLDGEPGATNAEEPEVEEPDAEQPDEEPVEDLAPDIKGAKDNGEDPNKPWYNNPIADQYVGPDLPDADSGAAETSTTAIPPVCSPLIGSVSVTETIGLGGKIDIVVWIDTSGSMSQEAKWTNENMNKFTQYLENKKIDYRLVLYGTGLGLCIGPPLGDGACNSAQPQKFLTLKFGVASTNGLTLMQTQTNFDKFKLFLRPDAVHNMLGITDDNSSTPAATFKTNYEKLLSTAGLNPKFVYHAICAYINEQNPNQTGICNTGASYSAQHIALAQSTGGTLFQVCKTDWTAIFDGLSKAIAATAKPVCTYNLPVAASKKYNAANVKLSHLENGVVVPLKKIAGSNGCSGAPDGWYYDNAVTPTNVTLCDDTCKKLVGGAIVFNFGCAL